MAVARSQSGGSSASPSCVCRSARISTSEIYEVLDQAELLERAGDKVAKVLAGMRQRLGIAACLIWRPRLLLFYRKARTAPHLSQHSR
jgi:ABC-type branched-subunit amino acid transport system ATPase component